MSALRVSPRALHALWEACPVPGSLASDFSLLSFPIAGKGPHCPPCCPSQNQASLLLLSCLVQPPPAPAGAMVGMPWLALGPVLPWMLHAQLQGPTAPR